jgi:hypothetical protein
MHGVIGQRRMRFVRRVQPQEQPHGMLNGMPPHVRSRSELCYGVNTSYLCLTAYLPSLVGVDAKREAYLR